MNKQKKKKSNTDPNNNTAQEIEKITFQKSRI